METSEHKINFACRVCNENGTHDLSESKFRCNDSDVLLIDAFNSFSTLNNVSTLRDYSSQLLTQLHKLSLILFTGFKRYLFVYSLHGIIDPSVYILAKHQTIGRKTSQSIETEIIDRTATKYRNG